MTSRGVFFLVFVSISAGCELGAGVAESGVGSLNGVDSLLVAPAVGNMRSDVESWLDSSSSSSCSSSSASESFLINLFLFEGIVSMIYSSNWLIGKKKKERKESKTRLLNKLETARRVTITFDTMLPFEYHIHPKKDMLCCCSSMHLQNKQIALISSLFLSFSLFHN